MVESWNGSAWTEVADVNTSRQFMGGMGADNTAALAVAGYNGSYQSLTENWNGSSWTEVNDQNNGRFGPGQFGTVTSALIFGGEPSPSQPKTEAWNGTSWFEVNNLNTGRQELAGAGSDDAAGIAFGGSSIITNTESWNGSQWTETNDQNNGRFGPGQFGTVTSALIFGGEPSPSQPKTEAWNGTSWFEVNNLNTGRQELAVSDRDWETNLPLF